jgi:hypothetical protein
MNKDEQLVEHSYQKSLSPTDYLLQTYDRSHKYVKTPENPFYGDHECEEIMVENEGLIKRLGEQKSASAESKIKDLRFGDCESKIKELRFGDCESKIQDLRFGDCESKIQETFVANTNTSSDSEGEEMSIDTEDDADINVSRDDETDDMTPFSSHVEGRPQDTTIDYIDVIQLQKQLILDVASHDDIIHTLMKLIRAFNYDTPLCASMLYSTKKLEEEEKEERETEKEKEEEETEKEERETEKEKEERETEKENGIDKYKSLLLQMAMLLLDFPQHELPSQGTHALEYEFQGENIGSSLHHMFLSWIQDYNQYVKVNSKFNFNRFMTPNISRLVERKKSRKLMTIYAKYFPELVTEKMIETMMNYVTVYELTPLSYSMYGSLSQIKKSTTWLSVKLKKKKKKREGTMY